MSEHAACKCHDFFKGLKDDVDFRDITLVCEGGERIETHRIILANASPVFKGMLSGGHFLESKVKELPIKFPHGAVKFCVEYMYTAHCDVGPLLEKVKTSIAELQGVLEVADYYDVKGLREMLDEQMEQKAVACRGSLQYAEVSRNLTDRFECKVRTVLMERLSFVMMVPELRLMALRVPIEVMEMLCEATETGIAETELLELCNEWAEKNVEGSGGKYSKEEIKERVFKHIRLGLLDEATLKEKVKDHAYIPKQLYQKALGHVANPSKSPLQDKKLTLKRALPTVMEKTDNKMMIRAKRDWEKFPRGSRLADFIDETLFRVNDRFDANLEIFPRGDSTTGPEQVCMFLFLFPHNKEEEWDKEEKVKLRIELHVRTGKSQYSHRMVSKHFEWEFTHDVRDRGLTNITSSAECFGDDGFFVCGVEFSVLP